MKNIIKTLLFAFFLVGTAVTANAQAGYRVQPGDSLVVEVLEDPSLNRSVLVLPGGTINFPFTGTLRAAGLTVLEIQQAITNGIAPNFAAAPTVFVSVNNVQPVEPTVAPEVPVVETIDVYFLGEINSPGTISFEPGITFLQAMSLAGGFTTFAATKRIQLRRTSQTGTPQLFTINFRALSRGQRLENNITLLDGDVILVPERKLFE